MLIIFRGGCCFLTASIFFNKSYQTRLPCPVDAELFPAFVYLNNVILNERCREQPG